MGWGRSDELAQALEHEESAESLIAKLLPTDTFYLESEFRKRYPDQVAGWGPANSELDELARKNPADTTAEKIARDFGVPHPTLAETNACDLLAAGPFPVSGGPQAGCSASRGSRATCTGLAWRTKRAMLRRRSMC